jgi:hypothetical protein
MVTPRGGHVTAVAGLLLYEEDHGRGPANDEARRIASNNGKLSELLQRTDDEEQNKRAAEAALVSGLEFTCVWITLFYRLGNAPNIS